MVIKAGGCVASDTMDDRYQFWDEQVKGQGHSDITSKPLPIKHASVVL